MLIINILLILLFFIILLYEVNIIEGQEEDTNIESDNIKNDNVYNYGNLLSDYDNIIYNINISDYIGFDIKNLMKKYNNQCENNNKDKIPDELYDKLKMDSYVDMGKEVVNVENEVNNLLGYLNIQIENDHGLTIRKSENNNKEVIPEFCSLVDNIYDEDSNLSESLINEITNEYGNCFTLTENNIFQKDCKKSCHLQEEKLEICNEDSIDNLKNCSDYLKNYENHYITPIHIKKDNGIYYNCSFVTNQPEAYYKEKACIPKNNICKLNLIDPTGGSCEIFNESKMDENCEDYYMFQNGNNYNCQLDHTNHQNGKHACVKNFKEHYNKPCLKKENLLHYDSCNYKYTN